MTSATSLCLLAIGLCVASADLLSSDADYSDTPTSDRRTFKHGKPVKLLPLVKKHNKFGGFASHVFGKTHYTEIPVIHESPRPFYKVHRYQGVEVKPVSDFSFSTPEPIIETHSVESPSDFAPPFGNSVSFSSPIYYPENEKPIFSHPFASSPPAPLYTSFVAPPPKPAFSVVPVAPQPAFPIPIASIPALAPVSIARPVPIQALPPPPPAFTSIPNGPPPLPQSIFSVIPIRFQTPVLPPLPAPTPSLAFSPVPVKIQSPALPSIPNPSPAPVLVKIPAPAIPTPSPVPVFPALSATPGPVFSSVPISLPTPQFQAIPSPSPSLPALSALPSNPTSPIPESEFPYPPSGTPIPSYIKDVSLGDIEIKSSPLPTVEAPKYEDAKPTITDDSSKHFHHSFGVIKNDHGFFQKIKEWKADKANEALSHFTNFKPKPIFQNIPHSTTAFPTAQLPVHPTVQFSGPLPLAPAPVFFPPSPFFSPAKYENFPPNNIESPSLVNSYGLPIPRDSYSPPHISHERLSSAASEEEPALVPPPGDKKDQNLENHPQEYQIQNFKPHEHPTYMPEDNQAAKEDIKSTEDTQPEPEDYKEPNSEASVTHNYPNHKE